MSESEKQHPKYYPRAMLFEGLKGQEDGTYKSLTSAVQVNDLCKSSLGHERNGQQPLREVHHEQQIFSPATEKAIEKWILQLDSFGFSPRVDILMGLVKHLAKDESQWQVQVQDCAEGKNITSKNWISRFLDQYPILSIKFASRIDHQYAYTGNPHIINMLHLWD